MSVKKSTPSKYFNSCAKVHADDGKKTRTHDNTKQDRVRYGKKRSYEYSMTA